MPEAFSANGRKIIESFRLVMMRRFKEMFGKAVTFDVTLHSDVLFCNEVAFQRDIWYICDVWQLCDASQ